MKKILILLIATCMVFPTVYGAVISNDNKSTSNYDLKHQHISLAENNFYIKDVSKDYCRVESKDTQSYIMQPGKPLLPKIVKTFELPFGATNIDVQVTPTSTSEQNIPKQIQPCPSPLPLSTITASSEKHQPSTVINSHLYQSNDQYPSEWYHYNVGVGINERFEHVTFVTVHLYPLRYSPAKNKIILAEQTDISISYTTPEGTPFPSTTTYDLAIIAPAAFDEELQPLITHKNNHGVETTFKTTEDIYAEYSGVDKPEQIKYFIKDALEEWNIKYVLLVGGLKSKLYAKPRDNANHGSTGWHVPVRYSNLNVNGDPGYPTDLYYADVYKTGGAFENWDSDGNGVFAEWPDDTPDDITDLLPDVAVGRLATRDVEEVTDVVNKIITYETTTYGSEWFKRIKVVSGDGFLDQMDLNIQWNTNNVPEGQYTINAQSFNPEGDHGPVDSITVTVDRNAASEVTFNHDDHLNPALENGYPAPPIAEIISVSEGNILGNSDVTYEPSEGEAYCNTLFWYANVSYVDGILTIRGKSYDPTAYGNITDIHVWVENSNDDIVFSDWRNNTPMYYEGEWVTGAKAVHGRGGALYYMPDEFDSEILWTSNGKFTGQDDVIQSFSEGCGFMFMSGHGSPNSWGDQYPGIPGNRDDGSVTGLTVSNIRSFPPFIGDRPIWPMDELTNTNKLPITVVGGCHNSLFNVSFIPSAIHYYTLLLGRNNYMWTYIYGIPECWSWYLVQMPETGAIATIGNTGLGWGWEGEFCTVGAGDGWISSQFFREYGDHYGEEGYDMLGHVYHQTQTAYINQFKDFTLPECWWYPDAGWDAIDQQAVEQWVLLGDPSLKIGGYP